MIYLQPVPKPPRLYAGHLPTRRFTKAEFDAMHVACLCGDRLPHGGFERWQDKAGRVIVAYTPKDWTIDERNQISGWYAVRPIIVVPSR